MKHLIMSSLGFAAGAAALAWNFTHRAPKVAYAETSVLMAEFSEAILARKQYEEAQKEWDRNLKALNDSLMAGMQRMKSEYDRASKQGKDSLRAVLETRNDDIQRYTQAVKQKAQEKEKELMDPVLRKLNSFLEQWGKQNGYDLIFGTMSGGNILQANSGFNVTTAVLKEINQQYRQLPQASAPADSAGMHPEAVSKVTP